MIFRFASLTSAGFSATSLAKNLKVAERKWRMNRQVEFIIGGGTAILGVAAIAVFVAWLRTANAEHSAKNTIDTPHYVIKPINLTDEVWRITLKDEDSESRAKYLVQAIHDLNQVRRIGGRIEIYTEPLAEIRPVKPAPPILPKAP